MLLRTPLACLIAALAWLVSGGGGWKDDGKEIRNGVQLAQRLCEEIFGSKQIPGLGEEREGKGQVGSESTFKNQAFVTKLFLKAAPIITLKEIA